jgi:hypothetical protein
MGRLADSIFKERIDDAAVEVVLPNLVRQGGQLDVCK